MPCEHFQDALRETGSGAMPASGDLREHLAACCECRAAFEREIALFSAIDRRVRATANAPIPLSLMLRFRAAIAESSVPARRWLPDFTFAAVVAVVVLAFFIVLRPRQPGPTNQANQASSTARPLPPSVSMESPRTDPTLAASANPHAPRPRVSSPAQRIQSSQPEVIVPAEEREGYALLLATLQQRSDVSRALAIAIPENQEPSGGAKPLEIAQLEVKPLENQESSASNRAEK